MTKEAQRDEARPWKDYYNLRKYVIVT